MATVSQSVLKLGEIASISSGLVVKRKQAIDSNEVVNEYRMLTLKSFEQAGWLNTNEFEVFESNEELDEKYLTKLGDVIVRLSSPYTAVVIDEENIGVLIPSLFVVIRMAIDNVLPGYLSIFLNSEIVKKIYAKCSIGSTIQVIKTSMLKDTTVIIKNTEEQRKIIELNSLILKERILLERLREEKTKYHNAILTNIFQN